MKNEKWYDKDITPYDLHIVEVNHSNNAIDNIRINQLCKYICKELYIKKELDKYCIHRILTAYKLYNPNNYNVDICTGYYGETYIRSATLQINNKEQFLLDIDYICNSQSNKNKIEKTLELEYGYITNILDGIKNYDIRTINTKSIELSREYIKKINRDNIYADYDLPIGICVKVGNKYRLVDGYHRFVTNCNKDKIKIIVGS
jgi:hypothetical protein